MKSSACGHWAMTMSEKSMALELLALQALAAQFLLQRDVSFQRTFVKQVGVGLEERGKFTDCVFRIKDSGLGGRLFGNLEIGSLAVEQLEQHPLRRLEADERLRSGQLGEDGGASGFDLLLGDHARIELWNRALNEALRQFRQSGIERVGDVHWVFMGCAGRCTSACMPGRSSGAAPVNSASTSMVPLAGSTTGLI